MNIRRSTPFWISLFIVAVLALAGLPMALAENADGPTLSNEEPLDGEGPEVFGEIYAEHFGVTVDEALSRFELQDLAGELDAELTVREAETFAGLWIEHTPQFKVVVLFSDNAAATIEPYLQRYPELAAIIEMRTAERSLVELQDVQQAFVDALRNLGIPADSEINVYDNRVKVYLADRIRFDLVILKGGLIVPDCVDVIIVEALAQPD